MADRMLVNTHIQNLKNGMAKQKARLEDLQGALLALDSDSIEYDRLKSEIELVEGNIGLIDAVLQQQEARLNRST
jgi:acyl carrier protein phosphodiesterase